MSTYEARLAALRVQLKKDQLDGFVVPICDEHMSEYVGDYAQRLGWLTGFGGSAGSAVVLSEEAAIFTDGRYTLQVREQVDGNNWEYVGVPETSISDWLKDHAPQGARIGYDAWVHTKGWVESATKALAAKGAELVAVKSNPIDRVWAEQPQKSVAKLIVHDTQYAGQSSAEKRAAVAEWLTANNLDSTVISALDSVAWLLNVRGSDVSNTPVALSFVLAHADGTADLFVAPEKIDDAVRAHLGNAVRLRDPSEFVPELRSMKDKRIAVDPDRAVAAIFGALQAGGAHIIEARDPTILPKAVKNPIEQSGHRAAQARDGAALSRFLHWMHETAYKGELNELSAAARLKAEGAVVVGEGAPRLPNTLFMAVEGWDSPQQLITLDLQGVMVSAGSACSSGKTKPSKAISAMGLDHLATGGVRVSGGWGTVEDDWSRFAEAWVTSYEKQRARHSERAREVA